MFDTVRQYETPEGTELELHAAGFYPRFLACGLDLLIRLTLYFTLATALGFLGSTGQGMILIAGFIGEWFYPVLFEVFRNGQTPGKSVMNLRVVHDDGTPVSWGASTLRNILRFADMQPLVFYGAGMLSVITHPDSKRIGDIAAGTLVVHVDKSAHKQPAKPLITGVEAWSPQISLTLEEQKAIRNFADQVQNWPPLRAIEITETLEPLTGAKGKDGVDKVLGIAAWLEEKR